MPYCKNCGKKVPLFKKCECTAAEKNVKNSTKRLLVLIVFVVFFILGLILGVSLAGSGTKGTVKTYVKAASSKKGGKTFYSLTMPDEVIKVLKDSNKYDDKVDAYNDMIEDMIEDLEGKESAPKFDKIMREKKLTKSQLKKAEQYFERIAEKYGAENVDITVTKGKEVKFRTKHKDEDGDYKYEKVTVCVVKVKGEGWKIAPMSADSLG